MKIHFIIPSLLLLGLAACNSGNSSESTGTDSSSSSSSMQSDTSHMAMTTTTVDSLPAIPEGAKVSFKNLKDGETVSSPLKIEMSATNISIDSAGKIRPNSGHFHIIIDDGDSTASGIVVPKDSTHLHFGNAQKEATITLSPGKHRLALQLADGIHRSYGSKLSDAITLNVKK